jgi:predicted  nucleic acid-binding Zn-ribbon protein
MTNPTVLQAPTRLYSAAEPEGRVFQAGEPWPGDVWSMKPGGPPVGAATNLQALKDLEAAQTQIEHLSATIERNANDLAVMAGEREAANDSVAGLEQRAIAAEKGQTDAEQAAKTYMEERDTARASLSKVGADLTAAKARIAELEPEAAKVEGLVAQLADASQANADLTSKLAAKAAKGAKAADAGSAAEQAAAPEAPAADAPDPA